MYLNAAQQALAESGITRACNIANAYSEQFPHLGDDFRSGALLASVKAAGAFDPDRGTTFSSWLTTRVIHEIKDVQRREVPKGYRTNPAGAPKIYSLSRAGDCKSGIAAVLMTPTAPEVDKAAEDRDTVDALLAEIPEVHEVICRRVLMYGETRDQVAHDLGFCAETVGKIVHESIALLQEIAKQP